MVSPPAGGESFHAGDRNGAASRASEYRKKLRLLEHGMPDGSRCNSLAE
jgi:hypothetical protein